MNKLQLTTCALLIFSISMVISNNNLSNQIKELQATVNRQANAIQQLEKEKNNIGVTVPRHSDSLSNED